ncbi:unnamed protein product [Effrenium voratum]|nr:unnamed protein product [Effrenium voratum]
MDRRLAWDKPQRTASEVLGPQLEDARRIDADAATSQARSGSSFWSASSRVSTARSSQSFASSQVCNLPKASIQEEKDAEQESFLPDQWETRLANSMTLRTVQNTMRHAHQLLQLLTKRYGSISPLHISSWEGALDKVAAMAGSKAVVQKWHSRQRELTPLHISALCGHANVVEYLLQLNADPDLAGVYNYRALHIAASSSEHISQLLLDSRASPTVLTDEADTPLHLACCYQQLSTIERLLEAKADPSATNNFGVTPLHIASATAALEGCDVRKAKAVLLLCSVGADLLACDRQGKTPAAVARMAGGEASLIDLLQADNLTSSGFELPGSPSHAKEAPSRRIKHRAAQLLAEEPASEHHDAELELENVQLKKQVLELQQDLENAQINVRLLRDSLDLQTLSGPLSREDGDKRLAEMQINLQQVNPAMRPVLALKLSTKSDNAGKPSWPARGRKTTLLLGDVQCQTLN